VGRLGRSPAWDTSLKVVVIHERKLRAALETTKDFDRKLGVPIKREEDEVSKLQVVGRGESLPATTEERTTFCVNKCLH
jgi:hypothetical protein